MRVQVIGVCRFSLLTTGGFKSGPADLDERAAFLFDPDRLARRMAWFRHVTLPSIRAQKDADLTFVVLASDAMPDRWKDELAGAVASLPMVALDFVAPGRHFQVCNDAFARHTAPDADVVAQFRLDDDDAVARDYVTRLRRDFADCLAPLYRRGQAVGSDYVRGFVLQADGSKALLHRCAEATWTPGQTVYLPPGAPHGLFSWAHHRLHVVMPTVTFHDANMFLRGLHLSNDSHFGVPRQDSAPWDLGALERRFDIRLDALQAALRAL